MNITNKAEITEWTDKELLEFQQILHNEVDSNIDLEETEEILTRLYDCFVMLIS